MLGLLQQNYLEQVVSRKKDKMGLTCIWALHGRRSIEYFCCVTTEAYVTAWMYVIL